MCTGIRSGMGRLVSILVIIVAVVGAQYNFGSSQTAGLVLAFSSVGGLMPNLYFAHL